MEVISGLLIKGNNDALYYNANFCFNDEGCFSYVSSMLFLGRMLLVC